jgi:hypothetical protein
MPAVLTPEEIENLRFHLGYGNLQVGAYPWTPDGFFELFTNVIALYLSAGPETNATTAVDASAGPVIVTVTPTAMTGIGANVRLVIDNGDDVETVVVKSVTATTFTAKFALSHDVSGYPIAVETGVTRLRELLHAADRVYKALLSPALTAIAGLQSVDKGEVVWFHGQAVQRAILAQYQEIIIQLSRLTRVEPVGGLDAGPVTRLEAY